MTGLQHYLETEDNEENEPDPNDIYKSYKNYNFYRIRNTLKNILLDSFTKYTEKHISKEQNDATMVFIYFFIKSTFFSRIQFVVFIIAIDFIDFLI